MSGPEEKGERGTSWIALLGLLLFVAVFVSLCPLAPSGIREYTRRMNCASNLRQIGLAIKVYAQENGEAFPPNFDVLYPVYVDEPKLFSCPSNPGEWQKIKETGEVHPEWTSYVYVSGLDDTDDAACVLAYDRAENHDGDGVYVLFLDTHVEWMPDPGKLAELLAKTRELAAANGHEIRLVGE